jgi:hypothetical protein
MKALKIIFAHRRELNRPELYVNTLFGLFYIGYISEITEKIIDATIRQLLYEFKMQKKALLFIQFRNFFLIRF